MVSKRVLLIGDKSNIKVYENTRNLLGLSKRKKMKSYETMINDQFRKSIRNRNIYMIFEGEEFYIKLIRIPKVRGYFVNSLIANELTYIFKDIDQFNFTYDTFNKGKKHVDVLVFCINSEKNNTFNNLAEGCRIRGVYLIQLCFFEYVKDKIQSYKSIVIVEWNKHMYIMACLRGKIVANSVIKDYDANLERLHEKIDYTISRADEFKGGVQESKEGYKMFLVNVEDKKIIGSLNIKYSCTNSYNVDFRDIVDKVR